MRFRTSETRPSSTEILPTTTETAHNRSRCGRAHLMVLGKTDGGLAPASIRTSSCLSARRACLLLRFVFLPNTIPAACLLFRAHIALLARCLRGRFGSPPRTCLGSSSGAVGGGRTRFCSAIPRPSLLELCNARFHPMLRVRAGLVRSSSSSRRRGTRLAPVRARRHLRARCGSRALR